MKILYLFLLVFAGSEIKYPIHYPIHLDSKIEKFVSRNWDGTVEKQAIPVDSDRSYFSIIQDDVKVGYLVISEANGCHINGCSIPGTMSNSRYELFHFGILFNLDFTIKKVKILEYESDYGYEICNRRWLKQFIGTKGCENYYGKNIDAISGATVSGESLVNDLQEICREVSGFPGIQTSR